MASTSRANTAYHQLQQALDAATDAAKALRGDLSKNGRSTLRDVEKLVAEARRGFNRNGRKLLADLEEVVGQATARATPGRKPAARRSTAAKPAARRTAATAKSGTRKTAAAAKSGKTGTLIYEFDPIVTLAA